MADQGNCPGFYAVKGIQHTINAETNLYEPLTAGRTSKEGRDLMLLHLEFVF